MAWNEPGGNGKKDPWGKGTKGSGPPDLDEVVRKLQNKLGGLFKKGGANGGGSSDSGAGGGGPQSAVWLLLVAAALVVILIWETAYIIQPYERGVVLRFGAYVATLNPGLNFRLPRPIESVKKVDVDQIRSVSHKATMLTKDENIVDVELAVQYRIKEVTDYLFKVRSPDSTLRQVTEAALRDMVGTSVMDFVLTEGRTEIAVGSQELLQRILDAYKAGLIVTSVNMLPAKPPEEVKAAFDDAIKAREDEQRLINEAEAYRNEVLPKSRGAAARIREDAEAYKFRVLAESEGDASRFNQLLTEYQKAPDITRQRLYLDTMGSVLSKTSKVFLDAQGSNSLMYLPIDKLVDRGNPIMQSRGLQPVQSFEPPPQEERPRTDRRERGRR